MVNAAKSTMCGRMFKLKSITAATMEYVRGYEFPAPSGKSHGAPSHWGTDVRWNLDTKVPRRWIGTGGPLAGPARSPELTALDSLICGYVKNDVVPLQIQSLFYIEERIKQAVEDVSIESLEKSWKIMNSRVHHILRVNSEHFDQEIIWIKFVEMLVCNTYWNLEKMRSYLIQRFFELLKDVLHTL